VTFAPRLFEDDRVPSHLSQYARPFVHRLRHTTSDDMLLPAVWHFLGIEEQPAIAVVAVERVKDFTV
jgi:hypothetical protein